MNDPSVIVAQNQRATSQKLVDKLKAEGYTVVIEKQAGINDIKNVYAFRDAAEAKQKLLGRVGQFEVV